MNINAKEGSFERIEQRPPDEADYFRLLCMTTAMKCLDVFWKLFDPNELQVPYKSFECGSLVSKVSELVGPLKLILADDFIKNLRAILVYVVDLF